MSPIYLHGRSLISALGADLNQAAESLANGGVKPQRILLPGGSEWPFFQIRQREGSWRERARTLVRLAIEQAGISSRKEAPLFIASSSMHIGAIESDELKLIDDYYHFAEEIGGWIGWRGPITLTSTACTSSMHSLLAAAAHVRSGASDEAVVLGIELFNHYTLSGFAAMQLLSPTAPRPLGAGRDGLVLGEAVAVLHLSVQPSRWRLCGGSTLVDGRDPTGALPSTVVDLCQQTLADSSLSPSSIDMVKVQAAGSPLNDMNEVSGLAGLFDPLPPLVSLKHAIGHTLGASGTAEIALLLECLERNVWPRADYLPDSETGVELIQTRPSRVRHLMALILGFGGGYAAVALEDRDG